MDGQGGSSPRVARLWLAPRGQPQATRSLAQKPDLTQTIGQTLRLQVLPDASAKTLGGLLSSTTEPGAIVHTDAWHGYDRLTAEGWDHRRRNQSAASPGDEPVLPRAHRAISNLKAWLHGTHRWAAPEHLQSYLNEYVFRHNRRGNPHAAFQTLLGLSSAHNPVTYRQIIDRAA